MLQPPAPIPSSPTVTVSTLHTTTAHSQPVTVTGPLISKKKKQTRRGKSLKERVHYLTHELHLVKDSNRVYREASTHLRRQNGTTALQEKVKELRDEVLRKSALLGAAQERAEHWRTRWARVEIEKDELVTELGTMEASRDAAFRLLKKHNIALPELFSAAQ